MLRLAVGLAFIFVPMLELLLLLKVGQSIGALPTVALVIATAVTGAYIISRQSRTALNRTLEALSEGRAPVEPVLEGLFLMIAGALMLTPGLITDVAALALLVPPVRRLIARATMAWLAERTRIEVETDDGEAGPSRSGWRRSPGRTGDGPVIDVEPERVGESGSTPDPEPGRRSRR
jgi:UPF0716 protein FxsA